MVRTGLATFTLGLSAVGAQSQEPQWPGLRGPASGTAALSYAGPLAINEWHYLSNRVGRRYKPGLAVWASPAVGVVAGRPMAFIGGYDQTLHALDLANKRAVWTKLTNGEIQNAPVIGTVGGFDVVFWGSADRTVYAVVAYSGRRLWTHELIPPSSSLGDVEVSSPLCMGGRLYVASFAYDKSLPRNAQRGVLHALDVETGQSLWQETICSGPMSSPIGFQLAGTSFVAIAARRGLLQCYAVDSPAPVKAWSYQMPHEVLGSPAVAEVEGRTLLVLGSKYGNLVAVNAATGREVWQRIAGNWFDNGACVGTVAGRPLVFAGSHDYNVYALDARDGTLVWRKPLGGEIHSAPCFFSLNGRDALAVAALDNHVYVLDAASGESVSSYFTGNPIWDKLVKGETLWGSPVAFSAGKESALVYGSFNDTVYALPLVKDCSLKASTRSARSLWVSLGVVALLFGGVIVPLVARRPCSENQKPEMINHEEHEETRSSEENRIHHPEG